MSHEHGSHGTGELRVTHSVREKFVSVAKALGGALFLPFLFALTIVIPVGDKSPASTLEKEEGDGGQGGHH